MNILNSNKDRATVTAEEYGYYLELLDDLDLELLDDLGLENDPEETEKWEIG